ncbi:MAG: hypothetical protein MUO40_01605 [Anaerolineaceae bacterium]|nr:hypothetical protein [Anaerolineaceae bacterium]
MREQHSLLNSDRLSVVMAMIMLAFGLTRIIPISSNAISFQILGINFDILLNMRTVMAIMTGFLAAFGSDWIIKEHPTSRNTKGKWYLSIQNWIVPVFTSFVISITLNQMFAGLSWWIIFGLGSILLLLIFIAQYTINDISETNHPFASVALTAITFALFLILAIAMKASGLRLYVILIALVLAAGFVCLRTFYIRLNGGWVLLWSILVIIMTGQITVGFYYLPLSPLQFGLFTTGSLYILISLIIGIKEERKLTGILAEPISMLLITLTMGLLVG